MAVLCLAHRPMFKRAYPLHHDLVLPRRKEGPAERRMVLSHHTGRMQTWNDAVPQGRQWCIQAGEVSNGSEGATASFP